MFVAPSCEHLPTLFKLCFWRPKMAPSWMSHVLFVEVLHPVNFVNITHVSVGRCVIPWEFLGKSVKHTFSCRKMYPV